MTKKYIGTKIVTAFPQEKDGRAGFGVIYADGYTSWSPKDVFYESYRAIEREGQALNFGDVLYMLKIGKKVARSGWNGKGLWVELQTPGEHSKMTLPYLYINYPTDAQNTPGARVPWLASQTDMLAEDWAVVE